MTSQVPDGGAAKLLLTIRALMPTLNEQEQKVGEYVLGHPERVIHLAMSDLSRNCGVSDATVFRFCKKVGTDGYQNFKIELAQDLAFRGASTYNPVASGDTLEEATRKVIQADIKALEDTLSMVDLAALDRAADMLLAARRTDLYGTGGSLVTALELQYKLMRVGVRAVVHTDAETQTVSAALLTPADVAVGISHSGESLDVLHALEVARSSGAHTVAVTNHPASPLAQAADVTLCTSAQEALAHGYPLGARAAQVGLIDMLYAALSLKRRAETEQNQSRIAAALHNRAS